jgi:A/G-specific adenine glycosylase
MKPGQDEDDAGQKFGRKQGDARLMPDRNQGDARLKLGRNQGDARLKLGPNPADLPTLRRSLLDWYRQQRRSLPWRAEPGQAADPYAVWISEIMLQQTRVEGALPYFERWMAHFPDLASLAAAPLDEVLGLWQGLGYYARARNLHRAAGEIMRRHGGQLPADLAALRALPGIGDYSAGAIASIAFGIPAPAVDGNVKRLLSRLAAIEGDPTRGPARKRILELAGALVGSGGEREGQEGVAGEGAGEGAGEVAGAGVPGARSGAGAGTGVWPHAGEINQALMELGALVCKPRAPDCPACPWSEPCLARRQGRQTELPQRAPTASQRAESRFAFVLRRPGSTRWLIARRQDEGLLGGLWEFPMAPAEGQRQPAEILRDRFGLDLRGARLGPSVRHVFTHIRLEARLVFGELRGQAALGLETVDDSRAQRRSETVDDSRAQRRSQAYTEYRWARPEELQGRALPCSTLMDKLMAAAGSAPPADSSPTESGGRTAS